MARCQERQRERERLALAKKEEERRARERARRDDRGLDKPSGKIFELKEYFKKILNLPYN